jgi:hypothetical protein
MNRKCYFEKQRKQGSRKAGAPNVITCEIEGAECYLWFDEDGELHGRGPKGAKLDSLLYRYTPLLKTKEVIEAVSGLEPVGQKYLPIKKFAVLRLMLDAETRGDRPEDVVFVKELIKQRVKTIQKLPDLG